MLKRSGQVVHRILHRVLMVGLGVAGLAAVGAGVLALRLSQEPLHMGWAVRPIQSALNANGEGWRVQTVALTWQGWKQGHHHPLRLELTGLTLRDSGATIVSVDKAALSLWLPQLFIGRLAPRHLWISDGYVALRRDTNGAIVLDRPSQPVKPVKPGKGGYAMPIRLRYLRGVDVHGIIALRDAATGMRWVVPDLHLMAIRQTSGSIGGQAHATLHATGDQGAAVSSLTINARPGADGRTAVDAALTPVDIGWLADHMAGLTMLRAVQARLSGAASFVLDPSLTPIAHRITATLGDGQIAVQEKTIALQGASVTIQSAPKGEAISSAWVRVRSPGGSAPVTLGLSGMIAAPAGKDGGRDIGLQATLDHVQLSDLPALWPENWQRDARTWITENLTDGTVHDGAAQIALHTDANFSNLKVRSTTATAAGDGVAVHWLRPVAPITDGKATLTLRSPDILDIAVSSARQGPIALQDGAIRITGLSVKDQDFTLQATAQGAAPDVIALLRHPRLGLLSRHPIALRDAAGAVDTTLTIAMPLKKRLTIDDIAIHAHATLTDMHIAQVAMQRDLDDGQVTMDVSNAGLKLAGTAQLGGLPAHLDGVMNFLDGPPDQPVQRLAANLKGSATQMHAAGFDLGIVQSGNTAMALTYTGRRNGKADADLHVNLNDAALGSDLLGWHKARGEPATVSAVFQLKDDHLVTIPAVQADAAGLQLRAHGEGANALSLDVADIGGSSMHGNVEWGGADHAIRFNLAGPRLNLAHWLHDPATPPAPVTAMPATSTPATAEPSLIVVDGAFDRLLLGGTPIETVRLHLRQQDGLVTALQAQTGEPRGTLKISTGTGERPLSASFDDAGAVAHAVGVLSGLHGGHLTLDGAYKDAEPHHPLAGTLKVEHFRWQAPLIVKLAEAMTVYGAPAAVAGDGLAIKELTMGYRLDGHLLSVQNAQLFNQAVGATASGWIDLAASTMGFSGTIVPAYFFNTLFGRLPVIGPLFSPGPGRGLFETSFTMRGPVGSPHVMLNPLSTLTPGILRRAIEK